MPLRRTSFRWETLSRLALDVFFPRVCEGCGRPCGEETGYLCWDCLAQAPYVRRPFCERCGDPVDGRVDSAFVCHACAKHEPFFDRARSAVRFRGVMQTALRRFKYRHAGWLLPDWIALLDALRAADDTGDYRNLDAVTCVPMHPWRQAWRGYNQAALLAERMARHLRLPFRGRLLRRTRWTRSQTRLTASQRAANVSGAFRASRPREANGKRILLIDDVMTTGATVNECARVLKKAGARHVAVLTVARG